MIATAEMQNPTANKQPEDMNLVRQVKNGDRDAFQALYEKYTGRIYALALRMTCNTHIAEDLVQEIFVRAWQKIDQFKGRSAFITWLTRLGINLVLSHLRSGSKEQALDYTALSQLTGDEPAYSRETLLDLETAIGKLPPRTRLVLVLHDIEGYKHKEIAKLAGIAPGTSKALLHKARKQIRKELAV